MPVTLTQHEDNPNLCVVTYVGDWTWADYYDANNRVIEQMKNASHPVDVMIDMSESNGYPPGNILSHVRSVNKRMRGMPNRGRTVMVTNNRFMTALQRVYSKVNPNSDTMHMVGSVDEALALVGISRS